MQDLELFEREAKVLKSLRYPSIPEYIDYFQVHPWTVFWNFVFYGESAVDLY